jgi:biotin synthase
VDFRHLKERIIQGGEISEEEAARLAQITRTDLVRLFAYANEIRQSFRGNIIGLCSIVNAKSGACPEDCSFCSQSSKSKVKAEVYPLLDKSTILRKAEEAKNAGVRRFSIVTSGRKASEKDLLQLADIITKIRNIGLLPCASLGLLNAKELSVLKDSGLDRYHHNLESSEKFFPGLCTTHTYSDKVMTVEAVRSVGLSVCSGGIFGMGETWQDRIDMAFALKKLDVDSVPMNFLVPIEGTPLGNRKCLNPLEGLKIIALYRFILPQKEIRICGGRVQILEDLHSLIFLAGADGMITGNYLTTAGRRPEDDLRLIDAYGFATEPVMDFDYTLKSL